MKEPQGPIGPIDSYQSVYVAECGEVFRSHREGEAHENVCHLCQGRIYETDEAREKREGLIDDQRRSTQAAPGENNPA